MWVHFPINEVDIWVVCSSGYYKKSCYGKPRFAFHLGILSPHFKEAAVHDHVENDVFCLICVGMVAVSVSSIDPFQSWHAEQCVRNNNTCVRLTGFSLSNFLDGFGCKGRSGKSPVIEAKKEHRP